MNLTPDLAVPYILRLVTTSPSPDTDEHRHPTPVPHLIYSITFSPSNTVKGDIKILEFIKYKGLI
jgi:hypothetical protein